MLLCMRSFPHCEASQHIWASEAALCDAIQHWRLRLTTGSWLQVRKSWFWPAMSVASFSSVGSARLPAATATSRGLSHACRHPSYCLSPSTSIWTEQGYFCEQPSRCAMCQESLILDPTAGSRQRRAFISRLVPVALTQHTSNARAPLKANCWLLWPLHWWKLGNGNSTPAKQPAASAGEIQATSNHSQEAVVPASGKVPGHVQEVDE